DPAGTPHHHLQRAIQPITMDLVAIPSAKEYSPSTHGDEGATAEGRGPRTARRAGPIVARELAHLDLDSSIADPGEEDGHRRAVQPLRDPIRPRPSHHHHLTTCTALRQPVDRPA